MFKTHHLKENNLILCSWPPAFNTSHLLHRSSPTWQHARLLGICVWWTCTPSVAYPPMPVVSLTPSSDQELLWAQLKTFLTGKYVYTMSPLHNYKWNISVPFAVISFATIEQKHLTVLSLGELICHGFTMGTNQDWPAECFRLIPFLLGLVSEEETRQVIFTLTNKTFKVCSILSKQYHI